MSASGVSPWLLWLGIGLGAVGLYGALGEKTILDETGIRVTYPVWFPRWLRRGWFLPWQEIENLKMRTTGQGGLVYYFVSTSGEAYLLPARVVGFSRLLSEVEAKTGIDTSDIRPLAQPWMYLILLGLALLLCLVDGWAIVNAIARG